MHELPESPYKMLKINKSGTYVRDFLEAIRATKIIATYHVKRFLLTYQPNGYIDIIKKATILKGDAFGDQLLPVITDFVLEVDTQVQFDLLQYKLNFDNHVLSEELNKWI